MINLIPSIVTMFLKKNKFLDFTQRGVAQDSALCFFCSLIKRRGTHCWDGHGESVQLTSILIAVSLESYLTEML